MKPKIKMITRFILGCIALAPLCAIALCAEAAEPETKSFAPEDNLPAEAVRTRDGKQVSVFCEELARHIDQLNGTNYVFADKLFRRNLRHAAVRIAWENHEFTAAELRKAMSDPLETLFHLRFDQPEADLYERLPLLIGRKPSRADKAAIKALVGIAEPKDSDGRRYDNCAVVAQREGGYAAYFQGDSRFFEYTETVAKWLRARNLQPAHLLFRGDIDRMPRFDRQLLDVASEHDLIDLSYFSRYGLPQSPSQLFVVAGGTPVAEGGRESIAIKMLGVLRMQASNHVALISGSASFLPVFETANPRTKLPWVIGNVKNGAIQLEDGAVPIAERRGLFITCNIDATGDLASGPAQTGQLHAPSVYVVAHSIFHCSSEIFCFHVFHAMYDFARIKLDHHPRRTESLWTVTSSGKAGILRAFDDEPKEQVSESANP